MGLRGVWSVLSASAALAGCATLAEGGGGDQDLPNASAGPFRKITAAELGNLRSAPNALDSDETFPRDAAVLDADGDPATLPCFAYVAATLVPEGQKASSAAPPNAIVRYGALDARSFDRAPVTVLEPARSWEKGTVGAPSVLRVGAEVLLYYAAGGGIGLARSPEGETFTAEPEPVLAPVAGGWEAGVAPASPGVVRLADGSFRMFYEAGAAIGEAASSDGVAWTRIGTAPALAPSAPGAADAYDDAAVGSPFPLLAASEEGRPILRLYYGARNRDGQGVIALAAHFGTDGPFVRAVSPVFGTTDTLGAREPWVTVHDGFTLLFATQRAGRSEAQDHPAIAAGVAPAQLTLPPPDPR